MIPVLNFFPLKYRDDPGLAFMRFCTHEDLRDLADLLMSNKGSKRWTEQLSIHPRFIENKEDLTRAWDVIAAELQRFGADTIASVFRGGKGVLYQEILRDVCKKLKIELSSDPDIPTIENRILIKVLESAIERMSAAERAELAKILEEFGKGKFDAASATAAAIFAAVQAAIAAGGFASYQLTVIVANAVTRTVLNRGLGLAANATLTRAVGMLAGPIGWSISLLLAVPIVSGPAFRVTVPAVIFVSYLRQKHLNNEIL